MMAAEAYQRPQTFHDLVRRLIELGYFPVPIPAGHKGPTITGWQNLRMSKDDVPAFFNQEDMLVGVLHKNNCFIDIDVYDAELAAIIADEAKRRFPGCLERVGQYPKTAIVVGLDECGYKVQNTIRAESGGLSAQVEIRTLTRQAVVYGKHPDTGQLYKWIGRELWETPASELPVPTKAEVEDFRNWADAKIREWAGVENNAPQPTAQLFNIGMFHTNSDDRATEEQFLEALKYAPADSDYHTWIDCLMGIHDFYGGSSAGLNVAQDWSADYSKYDPREVESKWRSFELGKGIGYKTVFSIAKHNGADLSAIARMGKPQTAAAQAATSFTIATQPIAEEATEDAPQAAKTRLEWYRDIGVATSNRYLVKGFLDAAAMSVLYGPSNSGKTFFGMDLAFHLALGREWRDRRVKQTSVLYLAAEGGNGAANRIVAFRKETGEQDMPFALRRAGLDLLRSEADLQQIFDLSQEITGAYPELPHLIVIDTLSRVMAGGDENTPADMTALIKNIDTLREHTGAHIMLVHHSGKDTARGARGHSSLRAATDTEIEVQNDDDYRAAIVTKQRDHNGGEEFGFTLKLVSIGIDEDGDEITSCIVETADVEANKKSKRKLTKNQKVLAETFDQMIGDGYGRPNPAGPGMPDPGRFDTLHMDDFRAACEGKMTAKNTRDAFLTAFDALNASDGIFCMASGLVWRTDRPKK
jgi:hypothetical protein